MAKTLNCPSCNGSLTFQSAVSVFAVCPYCNSTVVRKDLDVEVIGKMAVVDDSWSPMQLRTQGKYKGVNFGIVGRVQRQWSDGTWNEWFLYFDDGKHGWLSEAQGFYCVSKPIESSVFPPNFNSLSPGKKINIENRSFGITDIKRSKICFSEGELPFMAPLGEETISVDLSGEGGAFACIEYVGKSVFMHVGEYLNFDQLQFVGIRQIDGWESP